MIQSRGSVCGYPTQRQRNHLQLHWDLPDVLPGSPRLTVAWRHASKMKDLNSNTDFGGRDYFDIAGSWKATEYLRLRAGVNNIFEQDPTIAGDPAGPQNNGEGNVFSGAYDSLGCYFLPQSKPESLRIRTSANAEYLFRRWRQPLLILAS